MKRAALTLTAAAVLFGAALAVQDKVTYDDTPQLPGQPYKVHGERPIPPIVTPGRTSSDAPSDAVVLFDGTHLDAWSGGPWKVEDGYMEVNGKGSITSKQQFGDCQVHLEFACPSEVQGNSQGRANSGLFLMGRYEIQILDSYENATYPDGQTAAMYGQYPPRVNACRKPGEWQTYDVLFEAPRWEGEELAAPARVTVLHNGVAMHHAQAFIGATTHRQVARYGKHDARGPIQLQDHGNPVRFRNIWVRPLGEYDAR
jgi:hypothetical protein